MDEWQISLGYVRGSNIYVRGYLGFTCLVFKTTCIDKRKPLSGRRFFLHEKDTFPLLDKRNTRDKAKGLRITSERYIEGAGRTVP